MTFGSQTLGLKIKFHKSLTRYSLKDESTKWFIRTVTLVSIVLCANTLKITAEERSLAVQIVNGFVLSFLINGSILIAATEIGIKFRHLIIVPLILSGVLVGGVLWSYHAALIPASMVLHIWVGYKLFFETKR